MENYLINVEDKEAFKADVKALLDKTAFTHLETLKKEMANDFLNGEEDN